MEFKAVEFGYGQQMTLFIPSLRIGAGEKIAIVGENGAGKSTLARLIPRVYNVRSGSISSRRSGYSRHSAKESALPDLLSPARSGFV